MPSATQASPEKVTKNVFSSFFDSMSPRSDLKLEAQREGFPSPEIRGLYSPSLCWNRFPLFSFGCFDFYAVYATGVPCQSFVY